MTNVKINEEYAQLAPKYSEMEFDELVESIRTSGQCYPIVVNKDYYILDGHHRYRACQKLGIEPKVEVRTSFSTILEEKLFVYDTNLIRRNLNDFQKAEMLYQKEKLLVEIAKANSLANLRKGKNNNNDGSNKYSPSRPNEPLGPVAIKVTQGSGQSASTYKRAKYIIENGTEHQKEILRSGKSKINTIYRQIQNEKKRQELIIINSKKSTTIDLPNSVRLLHGDFRETLKDILIIQLT